MRKLLQVLYRLRALFVFVLLEIICFWFIYNYNSFQRVAMLNSSNSIAGTVFNFTSGITDYFSLKSKNERMAQDLTVLIDSLQYYHKKDIHYQEIAYNNKLLRVKIRELGNDTVRKDSLQPGLFHFDFWKKYSFIPAKVIKNEILKENNFITIDKGSLEGIKPGMGVINVDGIVGKVVSCSKHYSTIKSVLHLDNRVSVQVKRNKVLGSLNWKGQLFTHAEINYIPRHVDLRIADTVVTSGYNSIYPENIPVGVIDSLNLEPHSTFYHAEVNLSTDFSKLYYVFVVENYQWQHPDSTLKVAIP